MRGKKYLISFTVVKQIWFSFLSVLNVRNCFVSIKLFVVLKKAKKENVKKNRKEMVEILF